MRARVVAQLFYKSWPEIVNHPLVTSYENLVASAKFLVALATRKVQFRTLTSRPIYTPRWREEL